MPESFDIRVATSVEPPVDPQVSDIYFDAVSISAEPTIAGSDEAFEVASNPVTGGGGEGAYAHQVIASDDNKIKVRYGQVANIDTSGTSPDISQATEYTVSDLDRIFIQVTVDQTTAQPTAAEIYVNANVPADSAGTAYLQIARVTVSNGNITNIAQTASGSFDMLSCASTHLFCRL